VIRGDIQMAGRHDPRLTVTPDFTPRPAMTLQKSLRKICDPHEIFLAS
jgi:hypothetical protein